MAYSLQQLRRLKYLVRRTIVRLFRGSRTAKALSSRSQPRVTQVQEGHLIVGEERKQVVLRKDTQF